MYCTSMKVHLSQCSVSDDVQSWLAGQERGISLPCFLFPDTGHQQFKDFQRFGLNTWQGLSQIFSVLWYDVSLDFLLNLLPSNFKDTRCSNIAKNSQCFCPACLLQTICDFRILSGEEDADSFDSCWYGNFSAAVPQNISLAWKKAHVPWADQIASSAWWSPGGDHTETRKHVPSSTGPFFLPETLAME